MSSSTPNGSPLFLSPQARVAILQECGLGRGWVLLTMTEMGSIKQNIAAYAVERREILEAAYAMRDVVAGQANGDFAALSPADQVAKVVAALKMPLPPKPQPKPKDTPNEAVPGAVPKPDAP